MLRDMFVPMQLLFRNSRLKRRRTTIGMQQYGCSSRVASPDYSGH